MTAPETLGHTVIGVVLRQHEGLEFLLLRRVESRGGFWQPVTGRVDNGESPYQAVLREVYEETGIRKTRWVQDLHLAYEFVTREGARFREQAFALEVTGDQGVTLSDEHDSFRWTSYEEAIALVPYAEYRWTLARALALSVPSPQSVSD